MKRDMRIIRDILMELSNSDSPITYEITDGSTQEDRYNARILIEGGFVVGNTMKRADGVHTLIILQELTWEGNDLLASFRDHRVWDKISGKAGELTIEAFKSIASELGKTLVKASLGL